MLWRDCVGKVGEYAVRWTQVPDSAESIRDSFSLHRAANTLISFRCRPGTIRVSRDSKRIGERIEHP